MLRQMLTAKIHRATVTAADIHYVGSITIDAHLLAEVGILPGERVQVVDVDNGARLETYAIAGPRGQGDIQLNGAAARLVHVGDRVIIMAYGLLNEAEIAAFRPKIIILDEHNRILEAREFDTSCCDDRSGE